VASDKCSSQWNDLRFDLSFWGTEAMQWSRRSGRLLQRKGAHDDKQEIAPQQGSDDRSKQAELKTGKDD
jgi:hypothetical protein